MLHKQKYQTIAKSIFHEGIGLDEYLYSMEISQNYDWDQRKSEEDLYETCRQKGESKFISVGTFQIKEINEDEEQEEYEQPLISQICAEKHQKSLIENPVNKSRFSKQQTQSTENTADNKVPFQNKSNFQVKCPSKSSWVHKKGEKIDIVKHSSFSQTVRLSNKQKIMKGEKCPSDALTIYGQFMKPQKLKQIVSDKVGKIKMSDIFTKTVQKIHCGVRAASMSKQKKMKEILWKNSVNLPQIGGIRGRGITDDLNDRKKKKSTKKYSW